MPVTSKVHVKFFALFREWVGMREDWPEITPGTTVGALWLQYVEKSNNSRLSAVRAAFSVNQKLATAETVLNGGEEVAFLPPVSGGEDERRYFVNSEPLDLGRLIGLVENPGAGGIVTFTGVVRDNAHGRAVKFLEYEAYPEMAEKVLADVSREAEDRWPGVRLAIAHRTGHLNIGQASLMIAVSAPHRPEAFAACRYALERIKAILPVWKKEFASDDEYWVEGPLPGDLPPEEAERIANED